MSLQLTGVTVERLDLSLQLLGLPAVRLSFLAVTLRHVSAETQNPQQQD